MNYSYNCFNNNSYNSYKDDIKELHKSKFYCVKSGERSLINKINKYLEN